MHGKKNVIQEIVHRNGTPCAGWPELCGEVLYSHSASLEEAQKVAALVKSRFPNIKEPILINSIGTVIGSHTGPGTVALFFVGDKRKD